MAFWDNLGQKASETTAKAVQKAKDISDIARLNSMVSEEESKVNINYNNIGRLYVSTHTQDYEDQFATMIGLINESQQKITDYKKQIQDIKGVRRCEQCGAEVSNTSAFCNSCGAPMPKVESFNTDEFTHCESCGAVVKKGMRFCTSCGKPMEQVVEQKPQNQDINNNIVNCSNCGATLEEGAKFCTFCGNPVEQFTTQAVEEKDFIQSTKEEIKCPNCGSVVESDAAFCTECGTKL